jgi:cytochrome c peroxidase
MEIRCALTNHSFNKNNCAACHPSTIAGGDTNHMYKSFTCGNIGIPKNWENPFLYLPYRSNPAGLDLIDYGLAVTAKGFDMNPELQAGKFKVPTLRNPKLTAPCGHNGYFRSIKEIVHFYNTRDVKRAH